MLTCRWVPRPTSQSSLLRHMSSMRNLKYMFVIVSIVSRKEDQNADTPNYTNMENLQNTATE